MQLSEVHVKGFKRFTDFRITGIPATARLIVLAGPNGCGKSSFLEALNAQGQGWPHGVNVAHQKEYYVKDREAFDFQLTRNAVEIDFHDNPDESSNRLIYLRSAYRNDAEFRISELRRTKGIVERPNVAKVIHNDQVVNDNYQRLTSDALADLWYRGDPDSTLGDYRNARIKEVDSALSSLFSDLTFKGPGRPLEDGTFLFSKGAVDNFPYENLSAGEKAAFDLILDLIVVRDAYNNTLYCIDEPDSHMHSHLQGQLLTVLLELMPSNCQLMIATHSIGMMRRAHEISKESPGTVAFIDFSGKNFDQAVVLRPVPSNRTFWDRTYIYTLGDLAELIDPRRVIICEGVPKNQSGTNNHDIDASCYSEIFRDAYPDTTFVSGGSAKEVLSDRWGIGAAVERLLPEVEVVRFIDRDDLSDKEVAKYRSQGIRIQPYRNLETCLYSDEVLKELAKHKNRIKDLQALLEAKCAIMEKGAKQYPADNLKPFITSIYHACKQHLDATRMGDNEVTFMQYGLAPRIHDGMEVYRKLEAELFGS